MPHFISGKLGAHPPDFDEEMESTGPMIPPRGFRAEQYPLHHKVYHASGLSAVTAVENACMHTLVRNYKGANDPNTIKVNPHNANFVGTEVGAVCAKMSIIDKLKMTLRYSFTKDSNTADLTIHGFWMPIFFSFPEKLDAADEVSTTTVAALLELIKDATQEDVTPLFANTKHSVVGGSDRNHPLSTINLTETVAIMNMDTDATSEGITWDSEEFFTALKYYTNKGALKACIGKTRHFTLSQTNRSKTYHLNKFVPRSIRRIMPYTFFAILSVIPKNSENNQFYWSNAPTVSLANVGVTLMAQYHEWNSDHIQDATD